MLEVQTSIWTVRRLRLWRWDLSSEQTASKALVEIPIDLELFPKSIDTQRWRLLEWLSDNVLIEFLPETPQGPFQKHFASDADNSDQFFLSEKTVTLIKGGDEECIIKIDRLYALTGRSKQVDVVMNSAI